MLLFPLCFHIRSAGDPGTFLSVPPGCARDTIVRDAAHHLFLWAHPYTLPTAIARLIKGRSSHVLREDFPFLKKMPSLWTRSTFYSTAGNVSAETIQHYIERQSKS
jgi:transposase IS200 family protein